MKFIRIRSIVIGLKMIGQWFFFILTGSVPELRTAPVSFGFHIRIEAATAFILILSAIQGRDGKNE